MNKSVIEQVIQQHSNKKHSELKSISQKYQKEFDELSKNAKVIEEKHAEISAWIKSR